MFEKYYPGENIFIVHSQRKQTKNVEKRERVYFANLSNKTTVNYINQVTNNKISRILAHYLTPKKAIIAQLLKKEYKCKTYWIYYGGDLYHYLWRKGKYELYDNKKSEPTQPLVNVLRLNAIKFFSTFNISQDKAYLAFINNLDFFCFWNKYEYELLKKHIITQAQFKYFRYYAGNFINTPLPTQPEQFNILINHAASPSANHLTVLKKLKEIGLPQNTEKLIVPLSYGSDKIRKSVLAYGEKHFPKTFFPLVDFLPADEYFKILNSVGVAMFGSRRQEAGNNIYYMLSIGAKIFLRKENTIGVHLSDLGYEVFNFDKDLRQNKSSLTCLANELRKKNRAVLNEEWAIQKVDSVYNKLFF